MVWRECAAPVELTGAATRALFSLGVNMKAKVLTLVRAAARLCLGYRATLDAILRGELEGYQDRRGRWFVSKQSLERFAKTRSLHSDSRAGR